MEETVDDINVNEENMDAIFDDFEGNDLERHVGKTIHTNEPAFYDPGRPEKDKHCNIGSDFQI